MSGARGLDLDSLGRTLEAYLAKTGKPLVFHDRAEGQSRTLPVESARDPGGLLPVFLAAGEAVWREATGKPGFALDIRPDPAALFGQRLHAVGAGTFSTVMLSTMEAASQASQPTALLVNVLREHWAASLDRAPVVTGPGASAGASP